MIEDVSEPESVAVPFPGPAANPWEAQRAAMGAFLRHQREMANMSLRQLSEATRVSNAYLSQIERGMHDPTLRVLVQIGEALQISVEDMLQRSDASDETGSGDGPGVEAAVLADRHLTAGEKEALLTVYRSYRRERSHSESE